MIKKRRKESYTGRIKRIARRGLRSPRAVRARRRTYVIDTSVIVLRRMSKLVKRGLKGQIIIPNSIVAELERLANIGRKEGFDGLEELAKLQELKKHYPIQLSFAGPRPTSEQIRYAKSGEIDAMVRGLAFRRKATLVTADLVQAKSAKAYGIDVEFIRIKPPPEKKRKFFSFFGKKKRRNRS